MGNSNVCSNRNIERSLFTCSSKCYPHYNPLITHMCITKCENKNNALRLACAKNSRNNDEPRGGGMGM